MDFDVITALWCVYFVETERMDAAACAARHREHGRSELEQRHGEAIPITPFECLASRRFARDADKRRAAAMGGAVSADVRRAKGAAGSWPERVQEEFARRILGPNAIGEPNHEPYLREAGFAMLR